MSSDFEAVMNQARPHDVARKMALAERLQHEADAQALVEADIKFMHGEDFIWHPSIQR